MSGLIHIYCGDGKGKTTSAAGLAVRAAGAGKKVIFAQFLKNGSSSEIKILNKIEQIDTYVINKNYGFYKDLSEAERADVQRDYTGLFNNVIGKAIIDTDLLVLDEIIPACNYNIVCEGKLIDFLQNKPDKLEVVMTGRNPSKDLILIADYVTEMKKVKHPYDKGIKARYGIEF
ncbi:MAG: cob(I)yrinic acid a,c-diamide adenosyltransferase [Clostridia bacterium]|nr:cob(I)yrinic acid a,c-diamide adenosyltransferase [Clostridia bacterium]